MESNSWFGRAADFVMHTFIVYYCAMHLSEWLVFHWFGWIAPVLQISIIVPATDWYLQHFEWATILPALVLGYMDVDQFLPATARRFMYGGRSGSMARWALAIPTAVLLVRMLFYHDASSVLVGSSVTAVRYFFDIQKVMPTFADPLASDPVRMWAQMSVTAPFYAGIAYSLGALASKHRLLTKLFAFEKHDEPTPVQEP